MTNPTTKLQVTKDVKEALDSVLVHTTSWTKSEIIDQVVRCGGFTMSTRKPMNTLSSSELVQALFIGYEYTAPTPKGLDRLTSSTITASGVESLVARYKRTDGVELYSYNDGIRDGITRTLSELQITIVGINE